MKQHSIELRNLSIGYKHRGNTASVATNINATLDGGSLTCLLGANGVGKSTLMRTLSAFQPQLGGEVLIGGKPIESYSQKAMSHTISVVLTDKPMLKDMTVTQLVGLGRAPYTGFWGTLSEDDQKIVDDVLRQTGIAHLASRSVDTLSDGERQKAMIAKALAQQTPVILLDEPTAFLDFPSKVEMMQLLRRLAEETGKTILLSTHDVELALQIASQLWLMEKGLPVTTGTPHELANSGALQHFVEREGIMLDKDTLVLHITQAGS